MTGYKKYLKFVFLCFSLVLFSCGDELEDSDVMKDDPVIVDPGETNKPNIHLENHAGIYKVEVESFTWIWDSENKTNELFYETEIDVELHSTTEKLLKVNEKIFQQADVDSSYYQLIMSPDPYHIGTIEFFPPDSMSFYFTDAANGGGYVLLYRGIKKQ